MPGKVLRKRYGRSASGTIKVDADTKAVLDERLAALNDTTTISIEQFAAQHGIALTPKRRHG